MLKFALLATLVSVVLIGIRHLLEYIESTLWWDTWEDEDD